METSYSISGGLPQIEVTPYKGALLNSNRLQLSVLLIIFLLTVDRLLSEPTVYFSSEPLISLPVVIPVSFSDDEDSFKSAEAAVLAFPKMEKAKCRATMESSVKAQMMAELEGSKQK
ncbi:hypothetical protein YC2023_033694 [Brassica napus]